jgi:hypothetical protein
VNDNPTTVVLYRPVGQFEYELIRDTGFRSFPPRLPHQPIFYPVLDFDYAAQIARDWNTRDKASGFRGYVLRFRVRADYLGKYEIKQVGDKQHREYWIPAENLEEFNRNVVGTVDLIAEFIRDGT